MNCQQLYKRLRLLNLIFLSGIVFSWNCMQDAVANNVNQLQLTTVQASDRSDLDELNSITTDARQDNQINSVVDEYDPKYLFKKPSAQAEQAFQGIARDAMPMTPEQIIRLKEMLATTQRASAAIAGVPPKPTLSTKLVNLAPGALPPVIRLQQGFVTSIVFVDETGADWPIESYDLGNARAFNIQWKKGANVIMVQAINMYTYGNLAVKLRDLSTPVMLTLVPGQKIVDYRVDLRIQKFGPNAKQIIIDKMPASASNILLKILDGITPRGARVLRVSEEDCKAWILGDRMYLRTGLTVLSPGWSGIMTSPDGTNAYEMGKSPTVLVSKYGRPVELKIEGL
jgi:intracellular multiplication protein IcmK